MTEQFENPKEAKLENETQSKASPVKKIDLVAEEAATKSTKTVQSFDKDNSKLFSK